MQRYSIAYMPEPGRPVPTAAEIFRLLGLTPVERPDLWKLLTHLDHASASLVIIGAPADLGQTPFEAALVLWLCAARGLSVHIVSSKTQIVAEAAAEHGQRVYRTTADFAELATQLLARP